MQVEEASLGILTQTPAANWGFCGALSMPRHCLDLSVIIIIAIITVTITAIFIITNTATITITIIKNKVLVCLLGVSV